MKIDGTKISNPEAKRFFEVFFMHRKINREFYKRVPDEHFGFCMVDTSERRSDSPRESLAHQINVQRNALRATESGKSQFGVDHDPSLKEKSKSELLGELVRVDQELTEFLADPENLKKKVKAPWSKELISAVDYLWGSLIPHEILHTGWNLAIMDHLNIGRFPELKAVWG